MDYLNGLVWDGEPRIERWLSDVYGARATPYTMAAGRCWLIAGVARGLNPGAKVRQVLLIKGDEEIGKSLSLAHLCPFREWFTDNLPSDLHSKDAASALSGKWIVESAEMASMRKSAQEAIKAFLSRDIDDYRPAYGRCNIRVPRRCIIAATTNHDDVLSGLEENTRYLPFTANEYSQGYLLANRDQLWAEAVHLYRNGARWWFDQSDVKAEAKLARALFVESDPWDEDLMDWLSTKSDVTVAEALFHIGVKTQDQTRSDLMRVAAILKKLGWKKVHTMKGKRWVKA